MLLSCNLKTTHLSVLAVIREHSEFLTGGERCRWVGYQLLMENLRGVIFDNLMGGINFITQIKGVVTFDKKKLRGGGDSL